MNWAWNEKSFVKNAAIIKLEKLKKKVLEKEFPRGNGTIGILNANRIFRLYRKYA